MVRSNTTNGSINVTTKNASVDHWISRFGCPHSLHRDHRRNFESRLFEQVKQLLEVDKPRTTPFRPQPNAGIEKKKKNKTFRYMSSKFVKGEQNNWSEQLP